MCPSTSAYTQFCDGTTKSRSAVVKSDQLRASFIFRIDTSVESSGSSAVQRKASGSIGGGFGVRFDSAAFALSASETSGPCRVTRTSMCTGSAPLTAIVSGITVTGSIAPRNSAARPPASSRSR